MSKFSQGFGIKAKPGGAAGAFLFSTWGRPASDFFVWRLVRFRFCVEFWGVSLCMLPCFWALYVSAVPHSCFVSSSVSLVVVAVAVEFIVELVCSW